MAGRMVVGVDGSDVSVAALRWSYQEAELRGADLEVVHAWHYPSLREIAEMAAYVDTEGALEKAARAVLDHSVEQAGVKPARVSAKLILAYGATAAVLLEAARGADLLVVGARGRGGFASLLLGSVSQQCAHHAPCPMVIVPGTWSTDSAPFRRPSRATV